MSKWISVNDRLPIMKQIRLIIAEFLLGIALDIMPESKEKDMLANFMLVYINAVLKNRRFYARN
jgi:hypothetical protein